MSRRFARVGLVAKTRLHEAGTLLSDLATWLGARGIAPVFELETARLASLTSVHTYDRDEIPRHVDLMLVLGGDGTLLGMADRIAEAGVDVPIMGVNFGSLGFLTEVTLPELYPALEAALLGECEIETRMMLRAQVWRDDVLVCDRLILNDVVVTRGSMSRIIDLSVTVGGQFVTRFRADGVIIASPTGSTAYNLASGGPIVHPGVDAILLTPIAPHTLTNRPLVIPGAIEIRVQPHIAHGEDEVFATFDGQFGRPLQGNDDVRVIRASQPLSLVKASGRTYFEVLREKLKWGER